MALSLGYAFRMVLLSHTLSPNLTALFAPAEEEAKEEVADEAAEAAEEEIAAVAKAAGGVRSDESALPELEALPGLQSTGALTLVEKWQASFTGLDLKQAALLGMVVCNERSLTCVCKLQVRSPPC